MVNEIHEIKIYDDCCHERIGDLVINDDVSMTFETNGEILLDYTEIFKLHRALKEAYRTMFPEHFVEGGMYFNFKSDEE